MDQEPQQRSNNKNHFQLVSAHQPAGDQPAAIAQLLSGFERGDQEQILLGVTGSGKTFTMAHLIARLGRPALILAHNKTLAAQLYEEFRSLFPHNAVEYFVSYYDYYQPEAYLARTDTYIEKDLAINEQIERLRLSATRSLMERDDVIIVSSVSCIYGLGLPEHYIALRMELRLGMELPLEKLLEELVARQYERGLTLERGQFRVRGDVVELLPSYEEDLAIRIEFFGDEIEQLSTIDPLTGKKLASLEEIRIYPGTHHVSPKEVRALAMERIRGELATRLEEFGDQLLFKERLKERTRYDLELIAQVGHCKGIENYSRHFSERQAGEPPACLLDYFPSNFLTFIDESHQTLPQIRAMINGDRARKKSLVDFGFRLPSAYDNRPLSFEEFCLRKGQTLYVSATPGPYETQRAKVVEQVIRPTGLVDPPITILPAQDQVDDVMEQIRQETARGGRSLVTTLTKKMAEKLSEYLTDLGIRSTYLHSEIDTVERMEVIRTLKMGEVDVLIGINLLREGLDLPQVSCVAILDADKEGFLRSATSLIQTCGRAARNVEGRVLMYADTMTDSMKRCIEETERRRAKQMAHNQEHGITPKTAQSFAQSRFFDASKGEEGQESVMAQSATKSGGRRARGKRKASQEKEESSLKSAVSLHDEQRVREELLRLKEEMEAAAKEYAFEKAALLRDQLRALEKKALYQFGGS